MKRDRMKSVGRWAGLGVLLAALAGCGDDAEGGGAGDATAAPDTGGAGGAGGEGGEGAAGGAGGGAGGAGGAGGGAGGEGGAGGGGPTGPTWHADVEPLVARHCAGCHTAGGAGPFALDTYASARVLADVSLDSIEAGRMPPWHADPDCRQFPDQRIMAPEEKATFAAWVGAGTPEGDPADAPPPVVRPALPEPDLVLSAAGPYSPDPARPDDYRCLTLNHEFPEDTYIRSAWIVPDQRPIVHHVLVFVVAPGNVAELERADAGEPGLGYTCYGGPGVNTMGGPTVAWVPGMEPSHLSEGDMRFVPAGGRLVMQMHYNTLTASAVPDQTSVHLTTWDAAQDAVIISRPQADPTIRIPAGESHSEHVREFVHEGPGPLEVVGVGPHMHQLGTRIKVEVLRADGSNECLVDIPNWDFNWQQTYVFDSDSPVLVQPGERFRLTCVYDNSPENQPVINGERLDPRDVRWGEGTRDEMCLNFIAIRRPFTGSVGVCPELAACRSACGEDEFACLSDCLSGDLMCGQCGIAALVGEGGCVRNQCGAHFLAARSCLEQCIIGGAPIGACLAEECPESLQTISECVNPILAAGGCDAALAACGG